MAPSSGGVFCMGVQMSEIAKPKKKKKKALCILGTATTMKEAPFEDDSFEMWGVSGLLGSPDCKRLDKVFELHPWYEVRSMLPLLQTMEESKLPIYMQEVQAEVPRSVQFPRDELREMFHLDVMGDHLYVTNTITWMILLGIYEGYTDFSLFGVHMAHESEYSYQRASCTWALGIIHGKMLAGEDYRIHVPEDSEIMRARYEYGFGQPTKLMMRMEHRRKQYVMGLDQVDKQMEDLRRSRYRTEGALEETQYWKDFVSGHK